MADAWGGAWGSAWGVSWGAGVVPDVISGTGGGVGTKKRRSLEDLYARHRLYPPKELERLLREREEREPEPKPKPRRPPVVPLAPPFTADAAALDDGQAQAIITTRLQIQIAALKAARDAKLEQEQDDDMIALLLLLA